MQIDFCKKVAEFKFCAHFKRSLPMEVICKPMEMGTGYMLNSKLIFDKASLLDQDRRLSGS